MTVKAAVQNVAIRMDVNWSIRTNMALMAGNAPIAENLLRVVGLILPSNENPLSMRQKVQGQEG